MNKSSNAAKSEGEESEKKEAMSFYGILKVINEGTADEFEELLTKGLISNINMTNDRGETLLMMQCINHSMKGVKLLIEHGADVNITDGLHNTALILACRHNKDDAKEECAEIIKLLVTKGASINSASVFSSMAIETEQLYLRHVSLIASASSAYC